MIVPWMVNTSLYECAERKWLSGWASCVRMSSARTPPTTKKMNELIRYMIPIFLWSVVVSHTRRPRRGAGAISSSRTSVTAISLLPVRSWRRPGHDEDSGHGGPVDLALEVVLARRQGRKRVGMGRHSGELPRLEELLGSIRGVEDGEVVVDARVVVDHG